MPETSTKFAMRAADAAHAVLTCTGGLSWEDREVLADEVGRFLDQNPATTGLVVDLGAVTFVNSAGLGALFQLVGRLRARQGRLAFANSSPLVARMFTAVGMDRIADIGADVPAALKRLAEPAT
jgi:anti-anti-sigma factor